MNGCPVMIEFFFDCSSPWTYLAFHNIQPMAAELGVDIAWRPILVGGVFNAVNPSVYEGREHPVKPKVRYYDKDMQDWAKLYGLRIGHPTVFPVNSVKAMRGAFVAWVSLAAACTAARSASSSPSPRLRIRLNVAW